MQFHPETVRIFKNPFSHNSHKSLLHRLLYWNKKLPSEVRTTLETILLQTEEIKKALLPLGIFQFDFEVWLAGGAVRDLLLGKTQEIKDLDIIVSIPNHYNQNLPSPGNFLKGIELDLSNPHIQSLLYKNGSSNPLESWTTKGIPHIKTGYLKDAYITKTKIYEMILISLTNHFRVEQAYSPQFTKSDNTNFESYIDERLNGVIKLKEPHWKYPVDILITSVSTDSFVSYFDLDICKAALPILRKEDIKFPQYNSIRTPEEMLYKAYIDFSFLQSAKKQTHKISMNSFMNVAYLKHSIESHFVKIYQKYAWPLEVEIKFQGNINKTIIVEDKINKLPYCDPNPIIHNNELVKYLNALFMNKHLSHEIVKNSAIISSKKTVKI